MGKCLYFDGFGDFVAKPGGGFAGIAGRIENERVVTFEPVNPAAQVSGGVVGHFGTGNAGTGAEESRADFGNQFLFGVRLCPESGGFEPVKPARMAGPVGQFVEKGAVVFLHTHELAFVGHIDSVGHGGIKGPVFYRPNQVGLLREILEQSGGAFASVARRRLWQANFYAFKIGDVEHVEVLQKPLALPVVADFAQGFVVQCADLLPVAVEIQVFEKIDLLGLRAFSDAAAVLVDLVQGGKKRVFVLGKIQHKGVDSLIGVMPEIVGREAVGRPGFAPRGFAAFEGGNDARGYDFI